LKALVVIPARGGSKGLPGKNIKLLNGKPLIHYTIDVARELFADTEIIVSTDSQEIKEIVEQTGLKVPFLRPKSLATDTATTHDVLLHALNWFVKENGEPSVVILLQPTSPFRTKDHIKGALNLFNHNIDMVVSVKETESNPYYVLFEDNQNGFLIKSKKGNFTRRQDCPKVWEINGAIYIINTASLKKTNINDFVKVKKYIMDILSSIDIDNIDDFQYCQYILSNGKKTK